MGMANVVIFDKPYSADKQAEGLAISEAVVNGWCNKCRLRYRCECDPDFVFQPDCPCMVRKKEILAGWGVEDGK